MSTSPPLPGSVSASGRHQRRARNYLLDPHFQLKYTGLLVLVALLLAGILGAQLWVTSQAVIAQSQRAVEQGQQTVHRGQQMLAESRKVSEVVAMSITKDPDYADNPELARLFREDNAKRESELRQEQSRLEHDATELQRQSQYLASQQRKTLLLLSGSLSVLVLAIGLAGILFTHKIAGPVHKMKSLLAQVGAGQLSIHAGLRKGDELQHFFDSFVVMVEALRKRQVLELQRLDQALASLDGQVEPERLRALRELREDMQTRLDK